MRDTAFTPQALHFHLHAGREDGLSVGLWARMGEEISWALGRSSSLIGEDALLLGVKPDASGFLFIGLVGIPKWDRLST